MSPRKLKSPYTLGCESAGDRDAVNPFGQYDEDTAAFDLWEEGREAGEQEMSDEWADYCDPSMRDLYE